MASFMIACVDFFFQYRGSWCVGSSAFICVPGLIDLVIKAACLWVTERRAVRHLLPTKRQPWATFFWSEIKPRP